MQRLVRKQKTISPILYKRRIEEIMDFLERILRKGGQLEESMESNNNQGMELHDLEYSMYE